MDNFKMIFFMDRDYIIGRKTNISLVNFHLDKKSTKSEYWAKTNLNYVNVKRFPAGLCIFTGVSNFIALKCSVNIAYKRSTE